MRHEVFVDVLDSSIRGSVTELFAEAQPYAAEERGRMLVFQEYGGTNCLYVIDPCPEILNCFERP